MCVCVGVRVFVLSVYEYVCWFVCMCVCVCMKEQISQFNETDDKSHRAEFDFCWKEKETEKER